MEDTRKGVDLGNMQMIVKDLTIQNLEQISCSDSVKEYLKKSGKDVRIPIMTVNIKNSTNDWQSFAIYQMNLEVGKWSGVVSWELFEEMNENPDLVWTIPAGETKTMIVPYVAYKQLMSQTDWEKLDQDNYKIRFKVMPNSITVNVK